MLWIDLFAGPGGWDEGVRALGIAPLGIEWDAGACATRKAAGHWTLQADIAGLDPHEVTQASGHDVVEGLIASPPCPAFSSAGKGKSAHDQELILTLMNGLAAGHDARAVLSHHADDARAMLVVEPLRFALALRPRFIAFEQVPPALGFWEHAAEHLRRVGYYTWTGTLAADAYGVAQARRRAFLMASLDGPVAPPAPTHHAYNSRTHGLDAVPAGLLRWRSMYQEIGWGATHRPYFTLAGGTAGGPCYDFVGGSTSRRTLLTERAEGRWVKGPREDLDEPIVRLTFAEAGQLQGFPADYPWSGNLTSRALQIGNAVPPPLARAVVAELVKEAA